MRVGNNRLFHLQCEKNSQLFSWLQRERTMRQLPPLNALRAFDAAARHRNFTKAADELHVTHGAVSRQVAALESHFQMALFVRGSRALTLTHEGMKLADAVERAFDH